MCDMIIGTCFCLKHVHNNVSRFLMLFDFIKKQFAIFQDAFVFWIILESSFQDKSVAYCTFHIDDLVFYAAVVCGRSIKLNEAAQTDDLVRYALAES